VSFEITNCDLKLLESSVMEQTQALVSTEVVESVIRVIRGEKVILDRDIARLYGVETRALIQALKRNLDRFPEDFVFQLTGEEAQNLRFQ
jgi:hypothetical protein